MALFSRLLKLNTGNIPLEDFFTEMIAHLLESNQELLFSWFKYLQVFDEYEYENASVSTQLTFTSLEQHSTESRPDIVIELVSETKTDILFIESKIASQEGADQLKRYAEILDSLAAYQKKLLLYITRDFDPKDEQGVLKHIPASSVKFKQLRWYEFYQFLLTQESTELIQEVILFMQEYRMTQSNQFSSLDILSLSNFPSALKLMEATLWGEVNEKFASVLDNYLNITRRKHKALDELQKFGRYIITVWMPDGRWWCGLGFFVKTVNSADYPSVQVRLEVDPRSPKRAIIIPAMREISNQFSDWQGYRLNEPNAWSGIVKEKSLRDFLSQEDHVKAIEKFFLESLEDVREIRSQYSHLPWQGMQEPEALE